MATALPVTGSAKSFVISTPLGEKNFPVFESIEGSLNASHRLVQNSFKK